MAVKVHDYYNNLVVKFCVMSAYDKGIFNTTRDNWFDMTPQSTFVYRLIEGCLNKYEKFDDATYLSARETVFPDAMAMAQMVHGDDVSGIPYNSIYEQIDEDLNNVLRDMARGAEKIHFTSRIESLREALSGTYDRTEFSQQLKKGIYALEKGTSVEEVFLSLKPPEITTDAETTFDARAQKILEKPNSEPLMTGIHALDIEGGFERGNILTIGGDTGAMKTRFSLFLCISMLFVNPGVRCIFFEAEMVERDVFYIVCGWMLGMSYAEVRMLDHQFIMHFIDRLSEEKKDVLNRLIILDSTRFRTGEDVYHLVKKYDATFWVVDYLTYMVGAEAGAMDINTKVYSLTDKLKECAKRTNSFGIIISQLKKGTVEARKNKVPVSDDLEWSGRLKQISAYIFMVFFPSYYEQDVPPNYFFVKEAKSRFSKRVRLYFNAVQDKCTFYEPDEMLRDEMRAWWMNYDRGGKQ